MLKRSLACAAVAVTAGLAAAPAALPPDVQVSLEKRVAAGYNVSIEIGVQDGAGARYVSYGQVAPDESGNVTEFVLHQNGLTPHAKRIVEE